MLERGPGRWVNLGTDWWLYTVARLTLSSHLLLFSQIKVLHNLMKMH